MNSTELMSTYSIVAADADELGVAVQTHQMCVGSVVPWVEPGVGAVATQSLVNVRLGPAGLAMLRQGVSPERTVEALAASDTEASRRQFAVIDTSGTAAAFTGDGCIREASHQTGSGYSVQANMMYTTTVVEAMAEAFEASQGRLAERMLEALRAAQYHSGDIRGMQSAALVTVSTDPGVRPWQRIFDLRVDESDDPLEEMGRLVRLRSAQLTDQNGHKALEEGRIDLARNRFSEARAFAPELEELGFWEAIFLAEKDESSLDEARSILKEALSDEPAREQWFELIDRLEECGILRTSGLRGRLQY
jgi:uncharacterized Ntn-hydrolase superfamily protein